ncbi:MAG: polysaccharide biosynthesis/export family protein [Bacteroidaceae bacterium]|nr:polysaccharide biosynthesis/export family protein [Bacteroidaceae bacterium]
MRKICLALLVGLLLVGCKTPQDIGYFQDVNLQEEIALAEAREIRIKPGDKLSIIVNSKDPMIASMFNLAVTTQRVGGTSENNLSNSQQISLYTVDNEGNIDFPVLGALHVEGMNRETVAASVKQQLLEKELVSDPIVIVEFGNLYYSVLGEVARPGRFDIRHDRVTLLDAISQAGDLTITGNRKNVTVLREENGKQKAYQVDLTSVRSLYESPVYYLQQKDVVYVEPNDTRRRQSTASGNTFQTPGFWLSFTSAVCSVVMLVATLILKK